jgi:hypothetical protein
MNFGFGNQGCGGKDCGEIRDGNTNDPNGTNVTNRTGWARDAEEEAHAKGAKGFGR